MSIHEVACSIDESSRVYSRIEFQGHVGLSMFLSRNYKYWNCLGLAFILQVLSLVTYAGTFEESQTQLRLIEQHLIREHQFNHHDLQDLTIGQMICPHLRSLAFWAKEHCEIREADGCQLLLPEFGRLVLLFKEYSKNFSASKRDWERIIWNLSEKLPPLSEVQKNPLQVFQVWESTEWCSLRTTSAENTTFEREGLIIEPIDSYDDEMHSLNSKETKGVLQRIEEFFKKKKNLAKEKRVIQLFNDLEASLLKSISDENHWLESFDQGKLRQHVYHQHHWVDRCREMGALGIVKFLLKDPMDLHRDRLIRLTRQLKLMEEFRRWVEVLTIPVVEESLKRLGTDSLIEILRTRNYDLISTAISSFLTK